ncbi:BnaCnng06160D [Brassica napus]|uniref:BnaCnng06160D protein n=1 Tax=Brassica napus TaxID=3708 RepID=A0A078GQB0_BRANA|nr:BnaCnng06160D [Brassica napus]
MLVYLSVANHVSPRMLLFSIEKEPQEARGEGKMQGPFRLPFASLLEARSL